MSVNRKYKGITEEDLLAVADRFGIGTAPAIVSEVRAAIKAWPSLAEKAGVNKSDVARIRSLHLLM